MKEEGIYLVVNRTEQVPIQLLLLLLVSSDGSTKKSGFGGLRRASGTATAATTTRWAIASSAAVELSIYGIRLTSSIVDSRHQAQSISRAYSLQEIKKNLRLKNGCCCCFWVGMDGRLFITFMPATERAEAACHIVHRLCPTVLPTSSCFMVACAA